MEMQLQVGFSLFSKHKISSWIIFLSPNCRTEDAIADRQTSKIFQRNDHRNVNRKL